MKIKNFIPVNLGAKTKDLKDFFHVEITWSKSFDFDDRVNAISKFVGEEKNFLYLLVNDHGNSKRKDLIKYVGMTTIGSRRYDQNHWGHYLFPHSSSKTRMSVGTIRVLGRKNLETLKKTHLKEIEHILIWALWNDHDLYNAKDVDTLPGWGRNGTNAWHIKNSKFPFESKMPSEIVYPWIISK